MLGVLCLCFRFEGEMQGVFADLLANNSSSSIMIIDRSGETIASSHSRKFALGSRLPNGSSPNLTSYKHQDYLSTINATKGYQGFEGLGWSAQVMTPLKEAFRHSKQATVLQNDLLELLNSKLFSEDLKAIHKTSVLVKEDLNLVVLNGIIAAARQKAAEFMPVLAEIRKIGEDIASIFSDSIGNLQSTVIGARLEDVSFMASLAVDLMDRNLYERANDCRWWALTTVFKQLLQQTDIDQTEQQKITHILSYINDLYTVYSNLYVYDKNGKILALSNQEQQSWIGKQAAAHSGVEAALQTNDSQHYAVSDFEPSGLYNNRPTYIYNASITNLQQTQVVGGIGIVFDSAPQFVAMLEDTLPRDRNGQIVTGCFATYCQRDGLIISATRYSPQKVGELLELQRTLFTLENGKQQSMILSYQGKRYALGIAASKGYREYKTSGDYDNDILAFVMLPN
mgnify:CR=1 FL=1